MAEVTDNMVDAGLRRLGHEVNAGAPRPGPDLMARVLADAAAISPPQMQANAQGARIPERQTFLELLFGWTGGAIAALCLSLSVGAAVGMETEPGQIPLLDNQVDELTEARPLVFLPEDIL